MDIIYDLKKAEWLLLVRNIDMKVIEKIIFNNRHIDTIKSKSRSRQNMFIISYNGYVHVAPYIIDEKGNYIIKTVYPCRKYNKIYGDKK